MEESKRDNNDDGKRGFETETEKPYRDGGPMDPNRPAIQDPMHSPPAETPSSEDER